MFGFGKLRERRKNTEETTEIKKKVSEEPTPKKVPYQEYVELSEKDFEV